MKDDGSGMGWVPPVSKIGGDTGNGGLGWVPPGTGRHVPSGVCCGAWVFAGWCPFWASGLFTSLCCGPSLWVPLTHLWVCWVFSPHFMLVFWLLGLCYWLRPPGFSRCMWVLSLFGYLNSGNSGWEMRCPHRTVYLIVWSYLCLCFHPWLNVWFYVTSSSNLKVFTGPQFGMKNPSSDIKKYKTASCVLFRRYLRSLIPGRDWLGSCPGLGQLGLHRSVTLSTHKALFVCYIADLCEFALAVVA